jgi:hypothetical protein
MSPGRSDGLRLEQRRAEGWREGYAPLDRRRDSGLPWGLLATGLVVVGLGLIAWNYLGPDLRRYLKIERM